MVQLTEKFVAVVRKNCVMAVDPWYVDPLLGNDRETSNYTTAVVR
jgi:hypothetical protein